MQPYSRTFELDCVEGQDNHFELGYPHRGVISRVTVIQVSGAADGFEFDLYDSKQPKEAADLAAAGSSAASGLAIENFKILPTQTCAPSNAALELFGAESLFPYVNRDGSPTNNQRRLYCRITPAGTGDKAFQLTLCSQHD